MIFSRTVLDVTWIAAAVIASTAALAPPPPSAAAPQAVAHQAAPLDPVVERADRHPLKFIAHNLGQDLWDFGHLETLTILGAGGAMSIVSGRYDDRIDTWTVDHPAPPWTDIGRIGGDGWTQGALALGTWATGELTDHRVTAHVGRDLMRAQMLNMVTTRVLKIGIDRTRPSGGGHAFPSGHVSATFASAGVVHRHFGWKAGVPAYAAAGFVGLTRMRDRMHWVSDTVFGAAMGVAAAWTVTRGHADRNWTVMPVVVRGGGGVMVTRQMRQ